jgi:hypothetical protein
MARLGRISPACLRPREHPGGIDGCVLIVDPVQYQRRRDEREDVSMPRRSLHFGPDGAGLVTFLVCPPDDLVLVVKVQWLGG